MLAPLCAALALAVAATPAHKVRAGHATARPAPRAPARGASAQAPGPDLQRARALLAAVKRDPAKRRYRHQWERAIAALERAARGRDRGAALLDAARARYALYRYSQVDHDRGEALRLAGRADKAGAKDAAALAAAIRKEMGGEKVARAGVKGKARAGGKPTPNATANSTPNTNANTNAASGAPPPSELSHPRERAPRQPEVDEGSNSSASPDEGEGDEDEEEEESLDPALQKALASEDAEKSGAPAEEVAEGPAIVSDVKTWSNAEYTRVAIYLSRAVEFSRDELPADATHPRRLALDLAPAALDARLARAQGGAVVAGVRAAQRDARTVRLVLELHGRDAAAVLPLHDPPRLIVDVGPAEGKKAGEATAAADAARTPADGELAARRAVRRVVVDAGHGGHDTGAIGPTHVREKDVTLAMAQRLARRLEAKGYEVVLTRRDDRYVALEERTAIANARRGDLFVSLHANASPHRERRGVETYVLEMADGRYARRLAARENGALEPGGEGPDVRRVLADLDAQSSSIPSRRLAQAVQRELCAGLRGRVGDVRDLGVKSALFYVLVGARMPAILVETSFISNPVEERRLASGRFQDEVAASVARAIDRFVAREARVASAR